ncbi:TPA: phage tail protein [Serratia fonticola]
MTAKYIVFLTEQGTRALAEATATGNKLAVTEMAVGDGGGILPTPDPEQTALVNETYRAHLAALSVDPNNANQIIADLIIPEVEGGWWVREMGLFDSRGNLIAIGNCPEFYKPLLQEGAGRTPTVRMILAVGNADSIILELDPNAVLATREFVEGKSSQVTTFVRGGGLYCGVFFASSERPFINLVMSNDGLRFGDPIRLSYDGAPMAGRDPCILNIGDRWIISRTSYTPYSHDFAVYTSKDLLNWSNVNCKLGKTPVCSTTTPALGGTVPADKIWAPELVEYNGEIYVFVSIRANPDEPDINGTKIPSFRPYISKCTNIETLEFSTALPITMQEGNKIDPDVIYDDELSKFVMVIKDEYDKGLEVHTADSIYGPYSYLNDIIVGEPVEGPSIVYLGRGRKRIYFDPFSTASGIQYVETADWNTYSVTQRVDMATMRHGSVSNVNFDGNRFYDVIKLSGMGSSRSEVVIKTNFLVLSAGVRTVAPAKDTVYCTSGSNVVNMIIERGESDRFSVCVRSQNNKAGITLSGAVINEYKMGFGKNKDTIIDFIFDSATGKYRIVNFDRIPAPIKLVTSAGTTNINQSGISWIPDFGITYTTSGDDGDEVIIHDLPPEPPDGHYFNLMVRSAVARGAIRLKAGGAAMGNPVDIVISGATGDDSRVYRVEKISNRWYVHK